jgi:hypothetical protein
MANAASLAFGGSNHELMKATVNSTFGLVSLAPRHEGVHQAVHLRNREAADHADLVRLGHAARDHAGEVGGLLDVVVEDGEVGRDRLARRAEQEHRLREVLGDLARRRLDGERLADDELVATGRVLAHDALVVGVGDVLGRLVVDLAARLGGLQRLVDAAHPLLLERHRVDGGDLELRLGQGDARGGEPERGGQDESGSTGRIRGRHGRDAPPGGGMSGHFVPKMRSPASPRPGRM